MGEPDDDDDENYSRVDEKDVVIDSKGKRTSNSKLKN